MRHRAPIAVALAAIVALTPALALPALAAPVAPASAAPEPEGAPAAPKVVIVVGATHEATASYRTYGDLMYAEAIKYTPNVVKVYSPNATWSAVKAAAQNASILIYLGHGSGYPKSSASVFDPDHSDGMGLNSPTDKSDNVAKYYGESYMANEIKLARNAVVILSHLCYASGNSESGYPEPTYGVARTRIDNFASGFLRAGARAVIADVWNSAVVSYIRDILTGSDVTVGEMWATSESNRGHQMPFIPTRNPSYQAVMDPNTWSTGFYRSIVGALDMPLDDVLDGASAPPTGTDPGSFQAPGAASVGSAAVALYEDQTLVVATGAVLPAAAKVRVSDIQPGPGSEGEGTVAPALQVVTLDGATAGWVSGAALVPRDSAGPELWSMDGATTVSPNFDGRNDVLNLFGRLSESVAWTATIRDGEGTVVRSLTGTGHRPAVSWVPTIDGLPAPDGDYSWRLQATDAWGNPALDATGAFTVASEPTPGTGVLSFKPGASVTTSSTATFSLKFAGPVNSLSGGDLTRQGSASGCVVGAPAGGPTDYTITVTSCSSGTVALTLHAGTVVDAGSLAGPAGPITAKVTIDRTAPKVSGVRPSLRTGVALGGTGSSAPLPVRLAWTGTDKGAGIASYDVDRSLNGGTFRRIASATTATSLDLQLTPGASYRFRVRARDKAGNLGAWTASSTWYPRLIQQSSSYVKYTGTWATESAGAYSAGSIRHAEGAGATASLAFSGRAIAWVTTLRPTAGQVQVYVDGALAATIDTYAASASERTLVFARSWTSYGSHTIKLVVVGTADRPRADLDAFAIIK